MKQMKQLFFAMAIMITSLSGYSQSWSLKGNSGTHADTNFIGTTDNVGLRFKVNGQKAGYIDFEGPTSPKNTFFGFWAGQNVTTGYWNVGIGMSALKNLTTGNTNVAVGLDALLNNTQGNSNTAIGEDAMLSNVSGNNCVALGVHALYQNISGNDNLGIGRSSLRFVTTGSNNVAVGASALYNVTSSNNTGVGHGAGVGITTGTENTCIGSGALAGNSNRNVVIGAYGLAGGNSSGGNNLSIGYATMYATTTGTENTIVGSEGFRLNTTGSQNSTLGMWSGYNNTTGSRNIFIGYTAGYYQVGSDKFIVDNRDRGSSTNENTKSLLVGTMASTVASQKLVVNGSLIGGSATLATTATDGFWYVPTCSGIPTSTPTTQTGTAPMVFDSLNGKLYIYSGYAWIAMN